MFRPDPDPQPWLNPNSIGVEILLNSMGGGGSIGPCLCFDILIDQKLNFIRFKLKL